MNLRYLSSTEDYTQVWTAMQQFTQTRQPDQVDEIWLLQHQPVYTLGLAGRIEHLLNPSSIPLVKTDRGGQITYHGPGQIIAYVLFDLRRAGYFVKEYVQRLEQAVIDCLSDLGLADAQRKIGAPGVYLPSVLQAQTLAKIAALGIKVKQGCTYHGVSLNVAMDLSPFLAINPCGYEGLETTDVASYGLHFDTWQVGECLAKHIQQQLAPDCPLNMLK